MQKATFGAGCFWGVEEAFRVLPGVVSTAVGYAGGHTDNPTYKDVCSGTTGHAEVVEVTFDPAVVSYATLLGTFFGNHNPTEVNRQGPDVGTQYRSVIFYHDDEQKRAAEAAIAALDTSGAFRTKIATLVEPAQAFHRAEEYHQKYLLKRGMGSCHI